MNPNPNPIKSGSKWEFLILSYWKKWKTKFPMLIINGINSKYLIISLFKISDKKRIREYLFNSKYLSTQYVIPNPIIEITIPIGKTHAKNDAVQTSWSTYEYFSYITTGGFSKISFASYYV